MTRNHVLDLARHHQPECEFRKEHPAARAPVLELVPGSGDDPGEAAHRLEILDRIQGALPEDDWQLLLSGFLEQGWQDIAAEHAMTPEAVRKRFTRLVERVRMQVLAWLW